MRFALKKKTKKEYFGNLNEKNVCDNKTFWKTVKPFLSDKIVSKEQMTLVENNEIISEDNDVAQTLNSVFLNIVTNLKIPAYVDTNSNLENVADPIIKLILKYTDHPSILAIGELCKEKSDSPFLFTGIDKQEILKEILNLDTSKACQDTDAPTKILKENADIFADFLHTSFNEFVKKSEFPSALKQANITPVFKKGEGDCKNNYRDQLVFCLMFLRYLKELFSGKYQIIWIHSFQSINVNLGKDIAHNNVFCPCLKNGIVLWIMGRHLDYC